LGVDYRGKKRKKIRHGGGGREKRKESRGGWRLEQDTISPAYLPSSPEKKKPPNCERRRKEKKEKGPNDRVLKSKTSLPIAAKGEPLG